MPIRQRRGWFWMLGLSLVAGISVLAPGFARPRADQPAMLAGPQTLQWLPLIRSAAPATMPPLHVAGARIVDPAGAPVVLRGIALPDLQYVNAYRRGGVPALIDLMTAANGPDDPAGWYPRVLRLPVYPEPDEAIDTPGWIADPTAYFSGTLEPAVRHCISKQIYCIIDWHWISDYAPTGDPDGISAARAAYIDQKTTEFWSFIANRYGGAPNLLFELFNEPIFPDNWDAWQARAQPWIDLIRRAGADNIIIAGAPHWSLHTAGAARNPFSGGNIVYAAHVYPGHTNPDPAGTPADQNGSWDAWFGATAQTLPVMVTEFGWEPCDAFDSGSGECSNHPVAGTTNKFGAPFKPYIDSAAGGAPLVAGWTVWVADYCLGPVIFDQARGVLGAGNQANTYQGVFVRAWLQEKRADYFPAPSGSVPGAASPAQVPRQSPTCPFDF